MQFYLIVSAVMLFAGIYGFITRRNLLAILPWPLPKRPSPSPSSSIFTGISAILR